MPLQNSQRERWISSVFGMQGAGKTSFVRKHIIPFSPKPIFILDTLDEYNDGLVFYSMKALKHHLVKYNMNLSGVHILKADNDRDAENFFKLFTLVKEPCTILIEEADKFMGSAHYDINEDIKNIINYGRHWGQNIIFIARRPARLNKDVTSQSNFIVSFRQTESRDINSLKQSYDEAAKLPDLKGWRYPNPFIEGTHYLIFGNIPNYIENNL